MSPTLRPDHHATIHYRVLRLLEQRPDLTQRQLAEELGVSVGHTNYLIKALLAKGYVKLAHFQRGEQKLKKLAYLLTPEGLHQRLSLTRAYLERKTREYEALHAELASLRAELGEGDSRGQPAGPRPPAGPRQPVNFDLEAGHSAGIPLP